MADPRDTTVRFLVWNIRRRGNKETDAVYTDRRARLEDAICNTVHLQNIDVVVVVEDHLDDLTFVPKMRLVDAAFAPSPSTMLSSVKIYSRLKTRATDFPCDGRVASSEIIPGNGNSVQSLVVLAVHIPSKLYACRDDQEQVCRSFKREVEEWAGPAGSEKVLVGDFNMDPFEAGMVGFGCFHAVSSADVVAEKKTRTFRGEMSSLLYNPCWSIFGDETSPPGTYYYDNSGHVHNQYWHVFDQVLLGPALCKSLEPPGVRIISDDGAGNSLLDPSGIPNDKAYSDHLPLVFGIVIP